MTETLETVARVLGRCTIIGLAVVTLWFFGYVSGLVCGVHLKMFPFTEHECALLNYGGMGILKMLVLTFFLFPWIALRLELRRRRKIEGSSEMKL
jgi:hypothetical protein